jgi:hypothetical protein
MNPHIKNSTVTEIIGIIAAELWRFIIVVMVFYLCGKSNKKSQNAIKLQKR